MGEKEAPERFAKSGRAHGGTASDCEEALERKQMLQTETFITQLTTCGKQIKFTPERIQQIKNLIERGKSREEIAELIGVTVSCLQVTCSRLGISLGQPIFGTGAGLLERNGPRSTVRAVSNRDGRALIGPIKELPKQNSESGWVEEAQAPSPAQERTHEIELAKLSLRMQYRGNARITELPLTQDMIRQLAFEAQFRGMCMGKLVAEVIIGIAKLDLFQEALEQVSSATRCKPAELLHQGLDDQQRGSSASSNVRA